MKFCVQLNPQVSIDKPGAQLMPTLIEQVRVADAVGFEAFSMGDHYNIPACSVSIKSRLGAALRRSQTLRRRHSRDAFGLASSGHRRQRAGQPRRAQRRQVFFAFGLGYRDDELNAFNLTKQQRFQRFVEGVEIIKRLWTEERCEFHRRRLQAQECQRRSQTAAETAAADLDCRQFRCRSGARRDPRRRLDDRPAFRHR